MENKEPAPRITQYQPLHICQLTEFFEPHDGEEQPVSISTASLGVHISDKPFLLREQY